MKYKSECTYVNNKRSVEMKSAVDGLHMLLKEKRGYVTIRIKVKRREQLYMYINQIVTGVMAHELWFRQYLGNIVDIERHIYNVLEDYCVDKTAEFKKREPNNKVISYHEICVTYEDIAT